MRCLAGRGAGHLGLGARAGRRAVVSGGADGAARWSGVRRL
ncbi:hypothetical protein L810_5009 [Burkholderia sp. AU4i]|nr:hypothetical protein L810_5009 [Burkholderia sp. AU4i]